MSIEQYDKLWAGNWQAVQAVGPLTHTRYRLLSGQLPSLAADARIIDIGCGNGTYLAFLKQTLPDAFLVGVEPSTAAKSAAAESISNVIRTGELLDVGPTLPQQSFDLAICSEVLEHVADPVASLTCIYNLLKPGGRLLASVPGGMRYWSAQDVVAGHLRRFEFDDFRRLLEQTGFTVVSHYGWGGPFSLLYDRLISLVGPERVMRTGKRSSAKLVSRFLTTLFRADDVFKSRWGFQLVSAAVRPR